MTEQCTHGVGGDARAFVGRTDELALISDARHDAQSGHGRLVVIHGDAGVGKTWLLDRIVRDAEANGFRVAAGRCWPYDGAPALWPWQPILGQLLGAAAADGFDDDPPLQAEPGPERFARFTTIADQLARAAARTPLLVAIDDAHHAEVGALLLARFLNRTLERAPIMFVLSKSPGARTADTSRAALLDDLTREAIVLTLAPFDHGETSELLAARGVSDADATTVDALVRLTHGNPFQLDRSLGRPHASGCAGVGRALEHAIESLSVGTRHVLALAGIVGFDVDPSDLSEAFDVPQTEMASCLTEAATSGLVILGHDSFSFTHARVHEAVLDLLDPEETAAAHRTLVDYLAGDKRPDHIARRAHHALSVTRQTNDGAGTAIDACRAAAGVMRNGLDYERARSFLAEAVELADKLCNGRPQAEMVIELAGDTLSCGLLIQAREWFDRAAQLAEDEGDMRAFAESALGLGGVWLSEHRETVERRRVLALQRRALQGLPDCETVLRSRLALRLQAEAVYDGAPVEPVFAALDIVRSVGDDAALAESLSLTHHVMLSPDYTAARLGVADELIAVASTARQGVLVLFGLMWRTVDLYHLGDHRADRSLAELRVRVDATGCRSIGYIVAAMDVMRLIRLGHLEEAEAAAAACFNLGIEVGDADAIGYYGAHLLTIRWLQGRDDELLDSVEEITKSPTLVSGEWGLRAAAAGVAARSGQLVRARALLDQILEVGFERLPRFSTWLGGMVSLSETARALGDIDLATAIHAAVEPYAALPIMPSLAVCCLGSAERVLGVSAWTKGDRRAASNHFERAVAGNRALGNQPMLAMATADLAAVVAEQAQPTDLQRAADLFDEAARLGSACEMTRRSTLWSERALELRSAELPSLTIERQGDHWLVECGAHRIELDDLVGLGYLRVLVAAPGTEVSAIELCQGGVVEQSNHEVIDRRAVDAYRQRLRQLASEIDDADADADIARAELLRLEHDALRSEIARSLGAAGRSRQFTGSGERARTAVSKAIKRAIDAVEAAAPDLGRMLRHSVSTGATCRFLPSQRET